MNPIGGYFELADYCECGVFPHHKGHLLNTGRNALEFILRTIGRISRVYLPYYTCEVVLEPLKRLSIPWSFYAIDLNLEMADKLELGEYEYLIVNNYFGLKDDKNIERGKKLLESARKSFNEDFLKKRTIPDWIISKANDWEESRAEFVDAMSRFLSSLDRETADDITNSKGKRGGDAKETIINRKLNALWEKRDK